MCTAAYTRETENKLRVVGARRFTYKLMIDDLPSATIHRSKSKASIENDVEPIDYEEGIRIINYSPGPKEMTKPV